jgi:hypothetical protein
MGHEEKNLIVFFKQFTILKICWLALEHLAHLLEQVYTKRPFTK